MKKRRKRGSSRQRQNRQPVNQKHRDRLFRFAFQDRKDLLDLYNAINGTDYQNPEELKIATLEDAVFLGVKNDLSFIVGTVLNLYEHQSTKCRNMPLRGLIYFATLYQTYVKEHGYNLYGIRMIELPFPNYVVFYNGNTEEPDETELLLSEAFQKPDRERLPSVECRVKILNINQGHNQELIKRCRTEVLDMLLAEYDEQKTMEYIRREEREIGEQIGKAKGEALLSELISCLLADKRMDDIHLATSSEKERKRLYREYGLSE